MEFQIEHYAGMFSGFVKKTMVFKKDGFILKEEGSEEKPTYYSLFDAKCGDGEGENDFYIEILCICFYRLYIFFFKFFYDFIF